jgi:hypothetical protein
MATLAAAELQAIRNNCAATQTVNYTKPQINAAAQAVETFLTNNAAAISAAIDAATTPLVLTVTQKKKLVAEVVAAKARRDG